MNEMLNKVQINLKEPHQKLSLGGLLYKFKQKGNNILRKSNKVLDLFMLQWVINNLHITRRSKCSTTTRLHEWVVSPCVKLCTSSGFVPGPHNTSTVLSFNLFCTSTEIIATDISRIDWKLLTNWRYLASRPFLIDVIVIAIRRLATMSCK